MTFGVLPSFGEVYVSQAGGFTPGDLGDRTRIWLEEGAVRYEDALRTIEITAAGEPIGSWTDSSVNEHNASSAGTARPLEPVARDGGVFDGVDDAMATPPLDAYAGDFFVGMVLEPTTLAAGFVRFLEREPNGTGVYLGTDGTADAFVAFIVGSMSANIAMTPGERHAIAVERRDTTGNLYLDGVLVHTWAVSGAAIPDGATIVGGPDGSGPTFDGEIKRLVIVRDQTEEDTENLLAYLET